MGDKVGTLEMRQREVLVCTACQVVICPYCYIEDGEIMYSNECQGHVENITDGCDHGEDEE